MRELWIGGSARQRLSPRARALCLKLGVCTRHRHDAFRIPRGASVARRAVAALRPGRVVMLVGPSGSGKSTIFREIVRRLRLLGRSVALAGAGGFSSRRRVIDMPRGDLGRALFVLGQAGLAEAGPLLRQYADLSEGQRHRLSIALAIARCRGPRAVLAADEFTSALDRETAMGLSVSLGRWARRERRPLLIAASHHDVARWLTPDVVITTALDAAPSMLVEDKPRPGRAPRGR